MGKYQRTKGANAERELVNILKERGIPAKRISMMETSGVDKGDLLIAEVWKAEVKIGRQVPDWLYKAVKEGEDMLICRRDRKEWLVVMPLDWMLEHFF